MKTKLAICLIFCITAFYNVAQAEWLSESRAVRCLLGEASGEGYSGMYAVACAIRNRGTFKGVFGENAKHVDKESDETIQLAFKAWSESEQGEDVTKGATNWENIDAFGVPYWAKNMKKTIKIGHNTFYKPF